MTISPKAANVLLQMLGPSAHDLIDLVNTADVFSTTEAGFIDEVTAGTAAASKALVLGASKEIATVTSATITTLTTANEIVTSSGVGAKAGATVTAAETTGGVHKTTLTFADTPVVLADEAGVVAYGSLKVYDLPDGAIRVLGAVLDVDLTLSSAGVNDDWDGDVGVGTTAADNDASLATTEQNIIPTTATPQATSGATTANAQSTATEAVLTLDGTATAADVYVNLLVDDADQDVTSTPCNILMNGTLTLLWINLGDY